MISEVTFSGGYQSFWEENTPHLGSFLKIKNLDASDYATSVSGEKTKNNRKALITDIAFRTAITLLENNNSKLSKNEFLEIQNKSSKYISRFKDAQDAALPILDDEKLEIKSLTKNVYDFFKSKCKGDYHITPRFKGCGFVDACEGDVLANNILYEVKTVERNFHAPDLRQLLIYSALNYASKQYDIKKIALVNPRKGIFVIEDINDVSMQISGKPSHKLLEDIIYFISSGDLSK